MIVLAHALAPGLAAAVLIGLLAGVLRFGAGRADLLVSLGLTLVLAGLNLAGGLGLEVLPGKAAFWADSALLHITAYLAGAVAGWTLSRLARRVSVGQSRSA